MNASHLSDVNRAHQPQKLYKYWIPLNSKIKTETEKRKEMRFPPFGSN